MLFAFFHQEFSEAFFEWNFLIILTPNWNSILCLHLESVEVQKVNKVQNKVKWTIKIRKMFSCLWSARFKRFESMKRNRWASASQLNNCQLFYSRPFYSSRFISSDRTTEKIDSEFFRLLVQSTWKSTRIPTSMTRRRSGKSFQPLSSRNRCRLME